MDINTPLALLGGLTASQFMRKHWHKKPLLVRQAIPGFKAPIPRARLLAMAGEDGVESRLIQQLDGGNWKLGHGPLSRRSLPALNKPGWTVLVQGWTCTTPRCMSCCSNFALYPRHASMI